MHNIQDNRKSLAMLLNWIYYIYLNILLCITYYFVRASQDASEHNKKFSAASSEAVASESLTHQFSQTLPFNRDRASPFNSPINERIKRGNLYFNIPKRTQPQMPQFRKLACANQVAGELTEIWERSVKNFMGTSCVRNVLLFAFACFFTHFIECVSLNSSSVNT